MKQVIVKVFGKLRHYMPAGNTAGQYHLSFEPGETLAQLIEKLPLPADRPYLVLHNDSKIDADHFASITIDENDDIIVLAPVKGG